RFPTPFRRSRFPGLRVRRRTANSTPHTPILHPETRPGTGLFRVPPVRVRRHRHAAAIGKAERRAEREGPETGRARQAAGAERHGQSWKRVGHIGPERLTGITCARPAPPLRSASRPASSRAGVPDKARNPRSGGDFDRFTLCLSCPGPEAGLAFLTSTFSFLDNNVSRAVVVAKRTGTPLGYENAVGGWEREREGAADDLLIRVDVGAIRGAFVQDRELSRERQDLQNGEGERGWEKAEGPVSCGGAAQGRRPDVRRRHVEPISVSAAVPRRFALRFCPSRAEARRFISRAVPRAFRFGRLRFVLAARTLRAISSHVYRHRERPAGAQVQGVDAPPPAGNLRDDAFGGGGNVFGQLVRRHPRVAYPDGPGGAKRGGVFRGFPHARQAKKKGTRLPAARTVESVEGEGGWWGGSPAPGRTCNRRD
ncbi:MAG: hypothetical protein BJ554DRAFT_3696, partial [Olpidium bornovanus]